jgi:hypothetical protein
MGISAMVGFAWMRAADWIDLLVGVVGAAGLCAYAFSKRLGRERFWRVFAIAQPCWDLVFLLGLTPLGLAGEVPDSEPETSAEYAVTLVFSLALLAPVWLALFRYGYRSPALWQRSA